MGEYVFSDYTIELMQEDDGSWFAEVIECLGCMAAGDSPTDTVDRLRRSFDVWCEDVIANGGSIPKPIPRCASASRVCAVCGGSVEEPKTKRHGIGDGWVTFECDSKYHDRRG